MSSNPNIAVIGMGCVYPGALSPETLWENILAGRRYFRITPDERLPNAYYFDPDPAAPGKTYCNRMAVIDGWSFDPTAWKIPPITFEQSEIVHWLALHTSNEALKDAALDFTKTDTRRVGVVLGNSGSGEFHRSYLMPNRWPFVERAIRRAVENSLAQQDADELVGAVRHYYQSPFPELQEDYLAGIMGNVIAGRIANYYDFRSAAYTVDGACASSLLAVIHACKHLESGDMDVALCGGVDVSLDPLEMVGFAKTQALTKEDIRPYDAQASGIQTGEGCGIFVLATEDYARQHGYTMHALIKGWGISADGSGGITQPKVVGQQDAMEKAYQKAGYSISSVGYIEGHGTGTPVGDRVEITALKRLLDEAEAQDICHIGSLKANIGHTKAAAGAAGLMKAVFALQRKILPPHINTEMPNPAFGQPLSNLRPCEGGPWESDRPRRASVSAFGFGGANTHVTLEEVEHDGRPLESELRLIGSQQKSELLFLSAASSEELQQQAAQLNSIAQRICQAELTDLSAALARQRHSDRYRAAIVCTTPWQLAQQLSSLADGLTHGSPLSELDNPSAGLYLSEARSNPRLAALFPGQGSQRLNMTRDLLKRFDFVRELYQTFDAQLLQLTGESLQKRVFRDLREADDETRHSWEAALRNTLLQQPAVVASSLAILRVLAHFGLKPSFAAGHSLGEISALSAGGALQASDAFRAGGAQGAGYACQRRSRERWDGGSWSRPRCIAAAARATRPEAGHLQLQLPTPECGIRPTRRDRSPVAALRTACLVGAQITRIPCLSLSGGRPGGRHAA